MYRCRCTAGGAAIVGKLQAEQQESMVVLQAGAVEVCYSAASEAARCWVMLQAGAAIVNGTLQAEQQWSNRNSCGQK